MKIISLIKFYRPANRYLWARSFLYFIDDAGIAVVARLQDLRA